jgi:hypothetical protein
MQMQDLTQVVARASADPAFRADLKSDPKAVFARAGLTLPAGVSVKVFENDAKTFHAVLPLPENDQVLAAVRKTNPMAAKVYEKAWKDAAFKTRLMTAPRDAFKDATGVNPPAGLNLVSHEDTPQTLNVVIPFLPKDGELSDIDLENVAGGKGSVHRCDSAMAEVGGTGAEITIDLAVGGAEAGGPLGVAVGAGLGIVGTGLAVAGTALASVFK